jgi:hypothetical protein
MSTSHTTSSIPRVTRARRAPHVARRSADQTRFGTRVIDEEHQLVSRRPHRWLLAGLGLAVVMALGAALFVLPVQAWMRQRDDLVRKEQELAVLDQANRELGAEVDHLQTPEGAKEAAPATSSAWWDRARNGCRCCRRPGRCRCRPAGRTTRSPRS